MPQALLHWTCTIDTVILTVEGRTQSESRLMCRAYDDSINNTHFIPFIASRCASLRNTTGRNVYYF